MCAHNPIATGVREPADSSPAPTHQVYSDSFRSALAAFVRAAKHGRDEAICSSYMALRDARGELPLRDVLATIDQAVHANAAGLIIAAFSRRRCFMCGNGTHPCATCEGTGTVGRFRCPNCEGLGVETCPFCMGSGWYAWEDMPAEIRDHACHHRHQRIDKDLDRLAAIPAHKAISSARKATDKKRQQLASSLMGLQGKLTVLGRHDTGKGPFAQRCREGLAYVQRILEALRPPSPPVVEQDEETG